MWRILRRVSGGEGMDKIQEPKNKEKLLRNYAELISAIVDITESLF